ncbi:MAG TPA: substrate-binding domain-containing protein [Polyangiaceae bacterium]|nr:substrate-binding domain-containing protein [Polyangiaceae bacterium]
MRNLIVLSSFVAVGAVVSGAGALALKGSDTLYAVTQSVLVGDGSHDCGAATLTYAGTGSGAGENAMVAGTQQLSPMSRQIKASICSANPSYRLNAIALDGIAVLESRREGTANVVGSALNAVPFSDPHNKTCLGVKFSAGAPFDRIRAIFSGGDGSAATATGSAAACTSAYRVSTVKNWQNFTSSTCGHAGNPLRHAFRRDDLSGTTDAFKHLTGVTGFCNGATGQDNDPIRRACDPDEQVCGPNGDLGIVLPITVPTSNAYPGGNSPPDTAADRLARWNAGQFHRIHQSKTLAKDPVTGLDVTPCRRPDDTRQIGCLVAVSPYSTGYSGVESTTVSGATYLKVGNVVPRLDTIRGGTYPLARRLFVNDLHGNAAVSGDEGKLLACYLDRPYTDPKVSALGFFTFSDNPNDGAEAGFQDQTCF